MDKTLYTKDSIESLSPLEFTRLRPQVYCGSTEYSTQLLVEIFSNAVDEYRLGHGSVISVTLDGKMCIVEDDGQGFIPNEYREDGKTILEAAFSVLNTSGKYREDGTYEGTSLGSFGIGSKLATYLSHYLSVTTWRDDKYEHIVFKEGVFEERDSTPYGPDIKKKNGTRVIWEPSEEFFTHPEVNVDELKNLFKTISCLCPGLVIKFNINDAENIIYHSNNGINDLIDEAVKNKELIAHRFNLHYVNDKNIRLIIV